MIAAAAPTPGGLGAMEAALVAGFTAIGMDGGDRRGRRAQLPPGDVLAADPARLAQLPAARAPQLHLSVTRSAGDRRSVWDTDARETSRGGSTDSQAPRPAGALVSEHVAPDVGQSTIAASTPTVDRGPSGRSGRRATRRRPSGAAPPLPRHLRRTGAGWLIGAVVAMVLTVLIYGNGVSGAAITARVVDDTIVRWVSGVDLPGIHGIARGVSYAGSWWVIEITVWVLTVALIVFRRWRHLVIYLVVSQLAQIAVDLLSDATTQPRPFGVPLRGSWGGWAMPSIHMFAVAGLSVIALYSLVPEGKLRNRLKWAVAVLVLAVALARLHLGVDLPSAIVVSVLIGVGFAVTGFRYFAPSEVFPVTYRRGRSAHLDVGGARGAAIRKAVAEQLGFTVTEIRPFGLSESAGSTPLRLKVEGATSPYLFGKLYSRTHVRSDRWYKLGRELLYGRLEDEKPFNTVRRLVQQEDYALRVIREAGVPGARSYGFVELTPEREYMLVTEFLEGAVELGDADVDDALIDEALHVVRLLWDAGVAHRDIKPANLMVRDGRILLIDVAFAELRPTPWRQAVDLANMMLCLALRSSPPAGVRASAPAVHGGRDLRGLRGRPRPGAAVAAAPGTAGGRTRPPRRVPAPPARTTAADQGAAMDVPALSRSPSAPRSCSSCSSATRRGCSTTRPTPAPRSTPRPGAMRWNRCGCRPRRCRAPSWCPV